MFVEPLEESPNYRSYVVTVEELDDHHWVVATWFTDSRVTDHIKGDLTITEWRAGWDGPVKLRGERPATSLERAWLRSLIEVSSYDPAKF